MPKADTVREGLAKLIYESAFDAPWEDADADNGRLDSAETALWLAVADAVLARYIVLPVEKCEHCGRTMRPMEMTCCGLVADCDCEPLPGWERKRKADRRKK